MGHGAFQSQPGDYVLGFWAAWNEERRLVGFMVRRAQEWIGRLSLTRYDDEILRRFEVQSDPTDTAEEVEGFMTSKFGELLDEGLVSCMIHIDVRSADPVVARRKRSLLRLYVPGLAQ